MNRYAFWKYLVILIAVLLGCNAEGKPNGNNIPKWCNAEFQEDVNKAAAIMATPFLDRLDTAIKAKDSALFDKEYSALTAGCNACHTQMEHAFLVMKVPDNNSPSLYPDQVLGPTR